MLKITPMVALVAVAAAVAAFLVIRAKKAPASTVVNGIDMGKPGGW